MLEVSGSGTYRAEKLLRLCIAGVVTQHLLEVATGLLGPFLRKREARLDDQHRIAMGGELVKSRGMLLHGCEISGCKLNLR